ncbi:MAG: hypothetical protein IPO27_03760 [Bacteroidetes bacterium]|nr:hypothetical protein [Bacteroidota bacterium]
MTRNKLWISCLSVVIGQAVFAQKKMGDVNVGRPSRWSVGLMGSADWQGRFFKAERKESFDAYGVADNEAQNKVLRNLLKANEFAGFSYSGGLHFQYDLSKRWFARLGVYYSNKPIRTRNLVSTAAILPGHIAIPATGTKTNYPFIEVPLTFHYMLNRPYDKNKKGTCYTDYSQYNRKKPLFYVFIGPAFATNLRQYDYRARVFADTNLETNTVYVNPLTIYHAGVHGGVGLLKYLNKRLFLTVDLAGRYLPARWYAKTFKNNIDPVTKEATAVSYHVVEKPWSAGLQLGINYHF